VWSPAGTLAGTENEPDTAPVASGVKVPSVTGSD
jgi:hypothetical protein